MRVFFLLLSDLPPEFSELMAPKSHWKGCWYGSVNPTQKNATLTAVLTFANTSVRPGEVPWLEGQGIGPQCCRDRTGKELGK